MIYFSLFHFDSDCIEPQFILRGKTLLPVCRVSVNNLHFVIVVQNTQSSYQLTAVPLCSLLCFLQAAMRSIRVPIRTTSPGKWDVLVWTAAPCRHVTFTIICNNFSSHLHWFLGSTSHHIALTPCVSVCLSTLC